MANNIEIFGENMPINNDLVYSDEEWRSLIHTRKDGIVEGRASAKVQNTILRQATFLTKIFAEILVNRYNKNVSIIKPENYSTYNEYIKDLVNSFNKENMILEQEVLGTNFGYGSITKEKLSESLLNGKETAPWGAKSVKHCLSTQVWENVKVEDPNNPINGSDNSLHIAPKGFEERVYSNFKKVEKYTINECYLDGSTESSEAGHLNIYVFGNDKKRKVFIEAVVGTTCKEIRFLGLPNKVIPKSGTTEIFKVTADPNEYPIRNVISFHINDNLLTILMDSPLPSFSLRTYYDIIEE